MLLKLRRMIIRRVFLLLLLVASQYVFFSSVVFKIEEIAVEGYEISDPVQIADCCQFHVGDYYWLDRLFYDKDLLPANSTFKSLDVSLRRGGKVVVTVEDRKPVVGVWLDSVQKWYLADADGDILCPMRSGDQYPCLKLGYTLTALGSVNKGVIAKVLELEPKIQKVAGGATVCYIVDQCQNFTVYINFLGRETEVLLGNIGSVEPKLKVLDIILKTMRGKGRKLNSVDVRFRLPGVIAYNPNSPLGSLQNPKVSEHKPKSLLTEAGKAAAKKAAKPSPKAEKAAKGAAPASAPAAKPAAEPAAASTAAPAAAASAGGETPEPKAAASPAPEGESQSAGGTESEEKELKIADGLAEDASAGRKAEDLKRDPEAAAAEQPASQSEAALAKQTGPAASPSPAAEPVPGLKVPKPVLYPVPPARSSASAPAAPSRGESVFSADNDFSPIPEAFLPDE